MATRNLGGHGKVILLGEHAVVTGAVAIAVGLPDGVFVQDQRPADSLCIEVPDWDLKANSNHPSPLGRALGVLNHTIGPAANQSLTLRSTLWPQAGLGSSAALAVAIGKACDVTERLESVCHKSEKVFHETPSGIDVAMAIRGGVASFSHETGYRALVTPAALHLVVAYTGPRPSTASLVSKVQAQRGVPYERLGDIAAVGKEALGQGNLAQLGSLMNDAHHNLATLGVSSPQLNDAVGGAREAGALGAKLTGAGGGGCMVALVTPETASSVCDALQRASFESRYFEVKGPSLCN